MSGEPNRILIVLPSWLGDVVMATPAMRLIREQLAGTFIGVLARPGIDELLAGSDLFDQMHVDRARGVMGPKQVAAKLRPNRYASALLLTNSFSTALITRLAWIPRRIGYDRDGRGLLLTDKLEAPRRARPHKGFAPVPAVRYYLDAASVLLDGDLAPSEPRLELPIAPQQSEAGDAILAQAGLGASDRYGVLNPGANNPLKRWPAERFIEIGRILAERHGVRVLVNGSPGERELADGIAGGIDGAVSLASAGVTIGSLKRVISGASLLVTNDTGPRHIAAAFGVPTIALFGPTDPRWTTLPPDTLAPGVMREAVLVADPSLPESEVADDHPDRCRIDRIGVDQVVGAMSRLMQHQATPPPPPPPPSPEAGGTTGR